MSLLERIASPADLKALSIQQLAEVAQEIREAIFNQVSQTGGHLAPNLGVCELTVAMHYVFDFSHDRLLFDVGHQCYPHKLLTGRLPLLANLRTRAGMAGFPAPNESDYDLFAVGHAGTGISTAVGMARGDTLLGQGYDPQTNPDGRRVVTVVGDASIVNGLAMEGLNNAGTLGRQFLVVLNDNGMSISKPQGAMAQAFDRVRLNPAYTGMKRRAGDVLRHVPGGSRVRDAYHRLSEMLKISIYDEPSWFEHFGLVTVGPIDGHDIPTLVEFLNEARYFDRPMVLHVKTIKGKGYEFAEGDATTFHSPSAFKYDPDACRVEMARDGRSFTAAFGDAMAELMREEPLAVACTAAMPGGTGLDRVAEQFPDRTFDVGICESHAMDMLAGMAKSGLRPFFAVYSTFLQRAFDQAFQEVALQGLGVRLCLDRAGLVGGDGAVHHGFCDISILRPLPGAVLMAAIDEPSLKAALALMRTLDANLSAVRYPRDVVAERPELADCPPFEIGKARPLWLPPAGTKPDIAVLAYGTPAIAALQSLELVSPEISVALYDARFAKPVDSALIQSLLGTGVPILTLEDHSVIGGFGDAVITEAAQLGCDASRVTKAGLPDRWIMQDSRSRQLAEVGLDPAGIARSIHAALDAAAADRPQAVVTRSRPSPSDLAARP
jgi:1-deoxy-D-xylulose-5-phosphate synthase